MTNALSGESCVIISAVKPILSHVTDKLEEEDGDTDKMRESRSESR